MSISPINNVNNNIKNLSFGDSQEKTDGEKKPQISTQTKVIVGTGSGTSCSRNLSCNKG